MKRANHLFDKIVERENLCLAVAKAARGKRHRTEVQDFYRYLNGNLVQCRNELMRGTFPFGNYHQFMIFDPKQRLITAPCFAERVVHHAIMNVCEDVLERSLIDDTYACRVGKGREACVLRAQHFSRQFPCFLKIDIRRYFDSIDHWVINGLLNGRFKERRILALFEKIIESHNDGCKRGLPIGSLMSQHFANFYLSPVDRFVKEKLRVRGYVRYMDDMVLGGKDTALLRSHLDTLNAFLSRKMKLQLTPNPYINNCIHGVDFLGCRIFRSHVALNRRSKSRFKKKMQGLFSDLTDRRINENVFQIRSDALTAFTRAGKTKSWQFRSRVLNQMR